MTRVLASCLLVLSTLPVLAQSVAPAPAAIRTVTLPLTEYERLVDRADAVPARGDGVPMPAATLAAVLGARVDGDRLRGTLALSGTTLQAGDHRVPLLGGAAVVDARRDGAPLALLGAANGQVDALVRGAGPFALTADWTTDVRVAAGRASVVLPTTRAGTSRLRLVVPGDAADLRLSPGVVTARTRDGETTIVDATLTPGAATEVSWRMREAVPAASQPAGAAPADEGGRVVSDVSTLVTLGDTDVRVSAVVTLSVSRGALARCTLDLPPGFRLAGITGPAVDLVQPGDGTAVVSFTTPDAPTRRLIVTLDRPASGRTLEVGATAIAVREAGRERGDLAVEGVGTLAVTPAADATFRPIDARELPPTLRALAQWPVLAAWRYQRVAGEATPRVALAVVRFADADLAPAIADFAHATTLVTADGRMLTGVEAQLSNGRQPFLKVALPAGGRIVSAELDGAAVKPVTGADGLRLPLTRPGLARPARRLTFVYVQDGAPFAGKGERQLTLPVLDLPVAMYSWDVFAPETLRLTRTGGSALDVRTFDGGSGARPGYGFAAVAPPPAPSRVRVTAAAGPWGTVRGRAVDGARAVLPGVTVVVTSGNFRRQVVTDERGGFVVSGVPGGPLRVEATLTGFTTATATLAFDGAPVTVDLTLEVGALTETITVTGASPVEDAERGRDEPTPPHVLELQQRVAGVLPIRVEVPRTGRSYAFLTPLAVGDAPTLTVRYRRR